MTAIYVYNYEQGLSTSVSKKLLLVALTKSQSLRFKASRTTNLAGKLNLIMSLEVSD